MRARRAGLNKCWPWRCGSGACLLAALAVLVAWWLPDVTKFPSALRDLQVESCVSPAFYSALAVMQRVVMPDSLQSTCMNYGWAGNREPAVLVPAIASSKERYCLQLYDAVARAGVSHSFDASIQDAVGSTQGSVLSSLDVVEVGCGRGGGAAFLFAHHRPRSLVGIDASTEQIGEARRRFEGGALRFAVASAESLPVGDASTDLLLSVESMHAYRKPSGFLREVRRVLRPGGIFVFADRGLPRRTSYADTIMQPAFIAALTGLSMLAHVSIHPGVARAIDANTYVDQIISHVPRWVHYVIGPEFQQMLESFAAPRNGSTHRGFEDGRVPYVLGVYGNT